MLSQILKDLSSPSNEARGAAEAQLKDMRATMPYDLLTEMGKLIVAATASDEHANEKVLACVLFKKYYLDDRAEEKDLPQILPEQVASLKPALRDSLNFETDKFNLLRRKAEILCKLHKRAQSESELIQFVQSLAQQPSSDDEKIVKSKQFAMYALELLSEFHLPQEQIVSNQDMFMSLFQHSLADTNIKVKVATLKALTSFLTCFEEEEHVMKYKGMMGALIDLVIQVLQTDESEGKASLQSLIELTQTYADIWANDIAKLVYVCSDVMKTNQFETQTRQSALELVSTLAEANAKMVRDQAQTLQEHFFPAVFVMLTQVEDEDDLQAWADKPEQDIHGKDDASSIAAEALERLADLLGQNTMINCTSALIFQGVNNKDSWQYRQAGFQFLGMIAEACGKKFKKEFNDTVKLIAQGLIDEHPRVRFQSLMALGLVLNVASPGIQVSYHADLMKLFLKMQAEESHIKLKSQAVSCTINFVRGLIESSEDDDEEKINTHKQILTPYLDALVQSISAMLDLSIQQNYAPLQDETLALLSVLAEVLSDKFAQHYTKFMPALKQILQMTGNKTKEEKELRASCISTMGNMLESVKDNAELCRADALEITTVLVQQLATIEDTDPQLQAIQNAISMLAASLKQEFKPFLPQLMESLMKDTKRDLDFKIVDAVEEELENAEEGEVQKIKLSIKGVEGAKTIQMNTTALENKIAAIEIIGAVAQALGTHFAEYIEPVATLLANDLIHDKYSSSVRKNSTKICVVLIDCCANHADMIKLLKMLSPHIASEINQKLVKEDFRSVKWLMKELQRCFNAVAVTKTAFLTETESSQLLDMCVVVLNTFQLDKQTRLDNFEVQKKKLDEEDIEAFHEQLEKADRVWTYVMDISATLLKCMSVQCSPQVQAKLLPLYSRALLNLQKGTNDELLNSLCLLCDCLEFGSDELFAQIHVQAADKMIEIINELGKKKFDFVQTGIFALGCIALRTRQGEFAQLPKALELCAGILGNQQAFTNEKGEVHTALDNAVSCLSKICYVHQVDAEVVKGFLGRIPCVIDEEEAVAVHSLFLKQVQAQNPLLAPFVNEVKEALMRMANILQTRPDKTILNDEGKALLQQLCQA